MSSYNARVPADQQFQLIMECRNSGLSDYQWCKEHGIHSGTFYNWVSRLRRKACCEIPESISKVEPSPAPVQEVVRLNFNSKAENPEPMLLCQPAPASPTSIADISASIEISLGNATIRIANGTDPAILDRVLSFVKGTMC
ncbi:IS66 family insertion sequence element accessory protein TnpA [Hungatella effluvii]|uniref:IS66 family insertion sequence element accessory protein TnpA n=1 Tax=Hungatella effluvii TaxID=1096246 RepID=UPI0022E11C33|nr:IS66 family insertion sequence element accessory protein TnpB [Hungatella effluvii]